CAHRPRAALGGTKTSIWLPEVPEVSSPMRCAAERALMKKASKKGGMKYGVVTQLDPYVGYFCGLPQYARRANLFIPAPSLVIAQWPKSKTRHYFVREVAKPRHAIIENSRHRGVAQW